MFCSFAQHRFLLNEGFFFDKFFFDDNFERGTLSFQPLAIMEQFTNDSYSKSNGFILEYFESIWTPIEAD